MKNEVVEIIRILGKGFNELVFDFKIDGVKFNSIEWNPDDNIVLLHIFEDESDYFCDFEGINIDKQLKVFKILSSLLKTI